MGSIQKAAEQYYSQNSYVYPATTGAFVTSGVMQLWPTDPKGVGGHLMFTILRPPTALAQQPRI